MADRKRAIVSGSFDDLGRRAVRYLEEASQGGDLHVLLWSDDTARRLEGQTPRFPEEERLYLVQAIRYVSQTRLVNIQAEHDLILQVEQEEPDVWAVDQAADTPANRTACHLRGVEYRVLNDDLLQGFGNSAGKEWEIHPPAGLPLGPSRRKKVLVTGCFDWLHSGHVRFFEEASQLGDLYVVVGHDANVRLLKGVPHPLFCQEERRYMVQAIRYVRQALLSSGHGWLDAEPEITALQPDIYVVNEDGDVPEKRGFCQARGIEYVVLSRKPKPGLPPRQSTELRRF